jgi:hypothetical protein
MRKKLSNLVLSITLFVMVLQSVSASIGQAPDNIDDMVITNDFVGGSLSPVVTEHGLVYLSVDGLGTLSSSGSVDVYKPSDSATVIGAYLAAASTGYSYTSIGDGEISLAGVPISWDLSTPSSINSNNHWADVTSIVQPIIDAQPAGTSSLLVEETYTGNVDGSILAVIFNDPEQENENTVVLFFGAQDINGDTFNIGLGDPLDTSDPNLILDMSLGISFGYLPSNPTQFSQVDVNGNRLTTSAGGQDDGENGNGALITVGGLGDTNDNPADPYAEPTDIRDDDELYNLLPYVEDGDTSISVYTLNPSDDDNIFFSALWLGTSAIVVEEEDILLSPSYAENPIDTEHTIVATLFDENLDPIVGREVMFEFVSGPHSSMYEAETGVPQVTDDEGKAYFTYLGVEEGLDVLKASFYNSEQELVESNEVEKLWYEEDEEIPEFTGIGALVALLGAGAMIYRKRR